MENFKPHFLNINLFYQQCPGTLATGARSLLCWVLCRHGMKGQSWMQKSLSRQKIQMVGQKENTWQVLQQRRCIRGTVYQEILDKRCSGTGAALGQQMDDRERPCCL